MLRKFTIEDGQEPTEAQLAEVKAAAKRPVQFDEDAPELSPALYKAFECAARQRNRRNKNAKKKQSRFPKRSGFAIYFKKYLILVKKLLQNAGR